MGHCYRILLTAFLITAFTPKTGSTDGMYPLDRLPAEKLEKLGIELSVEEIRTLAEGAAPKFNDGCSANLVSNKGIAFTNHHCGAGLVAAYQDMIQEKHGKDHEHAWIKRDGFVAKTMADEIKMDGANIKVYLGQDNVSSLLLPYTAIKDPKTRHEKLEAEKKKLVKTCKGDDGSIFCEIGFENNEPAPFMMYRYRFIKDVRLLWTPPEALGRFGGDTDNWEYPRYTVDFTFFRVYENDKPYIPSLNTSFSANGVHPGDAQMVIGYPGSTERNVTSVTAEANRDRDYYWRLHQPRDLFTDAIEAYFNQPEVEETLAASGYYQRHARLENYNENGLRKSDLVDLLDIPAKMRAIEEEVQSPYTAPIAALYRNYYHYWPIRSVLNYIAHPEVTPLFYLAAARTVLNYEDPEDATQEEIAAARKEAANEIQGILQNKSVHAERFMASLILERISRTPNGTPRAVTQLRAATERTAKECLENPNGLDSSGLFTYETFCKSRKGTIYDQMALLLYTSVLIPVNDSTDAKAAAEQARLALLGLIGDPVKDKRGKETTPSARDARIASGDNVFIFLADVQSELKEINNDPNKFGGMTWNYWYLNWKNNLLVGRPFPDANFSIRMTFGNVSDSYSPAYLDDAPVYPHATTLRGWLQHSERVLKDMPATHPDFDLFHIPQEVRDAVGKVDSYKGKWYFDKKLGDVPINFINNLVITGGNSGSGVYNKDGEIVGIVFDGTPESIIGDVMHNPDARTISVDLRIIAFLADMVYPDARYILEESGLSFDQAPLHSN